MVGGHTVNGDNLYGTVYQLKWTYIANLDRWIGHTKLGPCFFCALQVSSDLKLTIPKGETI